MIKVLIADDHLIIRKGIKQLLEADPEIKVTGEASDGNEAICKVRENDYDVILLDISMPGKNGLEALSELRAEKPEIAVLFLSMYSEDRYAIRAFKEGASGYLTKEKTPDELISAIKKVAAGKKYVSASLAEKLVTDLGTNKHELPHECLSNREYSVLCMIASGKAIRDIADEMSLSPKTISTYRSRILKKMGLKNNMEMIHYAIKTGLSTNLDDCQTIISQ